jgi:hypothetical protein
VTDSFQEEFISERLPPSTARRGILGLSLGVALGVVVAAAIVGALILIRFILLPPGSLT